MKLRNSLLIILLMTLLITTGCATTKYLEEMGLVAAAGFDQIEDNRILGTIVMHFFDPEAQQATKVFSSTGYSLKGTIQSMNSKSNKKIVTGQLRLLLLGEKIAREGVYDILDPLARDPEVGTMLYITVVKGRANDILEHEYENIGNIGTYLYETIKQNIAGESMISPTLHEFVHDFYDEGKDPIVPYIERKGDDITVLGTAIFKKDKMVGYLPPQATFFIKLLRDRFNLGTFESAVPAKDLEQYIKGKSKGKEVFMVFNNLSSDRKIKLIDAETPEFDINIKMATRLQEVSEQMNLSDEEVINGIEEALEKSIAIQGNKFLKQLQELGSDPVGFGEVYRSSLRKKDITTKEWYELYKTATFNLTADITIVKTGIME